MSGRFQSNAEEKTDQICIMCPINADVRRRIVVLKAIERKLLHKREKFFFLAIFGLRRRYAHLQYVVRTVRTVEYRRYAAIFWYIFGYSEN